jgi:hypothetical protein
MTLTFPDLFPPLALFTSSLQLFTTQRRGGAPCKTYTQESSLISEAVVAPVDMWITRLEMAHKCAKAPYMAYVTSRKAYIWRFGAAYKSILINIWAVDNSGSYAHYQQWLYERAAYRKSYPHFRLSYPQLIHKLSTFGRARGSACIADFDDLVVD